MVFAHDTEVALAAAVDLANTRAGRSDGDRLASVEDLDALVAGWSFTGSRGDRQEELADVRALREEIARLWTAGDADVVAEGVNRLLADGGARPQLVRHDGWDWHLHATDPDQPLGTRMAVEAAMALLDVVRADELERLKRCGADDCDDLHLDLSRNRSRRYCGTRCGNRADAAAYRARKAAGEQVQDQPRLTPAASPPP